MRSADVHVEVLSDASRLARRVADWMVDAAIATEGDFAVALAGGSTPRGIYELLAEPPDRDRFPWERAHWFWGDERFVPHDDARSNYRMAWDAMLSHAPAPPGHIHPVPTENIAPEAAASAYENALKSFYGAAALDPARPLFALNLLGLGEDGHFASLFPGNEVLQERRQWVASVNDDLPEPRITLTYPALESCRHAAFLVVGANKREILRRLRAGDPALPPSHYHPIGELRLFVDREAGGEELSQNPES